MSSIRLNTLSNYTRHGYWIRLVCPCGHRVDLDPLVLGHRLHVHRHNQQLEMAMRHLVCSACGRREPDHMPCFPPGE